MPKNKNANQKAAKEQSLPTVRTIPDQVVKNVIRKVILGEDHRTEILALINTAFLEYAIDFFGKVALAKMNDKAITSDWYKREFLSDKLSTKDLVLNSGLNEKSVKASYGSTSKDIVLPVSQKHYEELLEIIESLTQANNDIDITLNITFKGVSVQLNINESLIVVNTLAVKRAAITGGFWSSTGKRVEKHLMETLCKVFQVPIYNYDQTHNPTATREVDFYLTGPNDEKYPCEVKLMNAGNPESADAIISRKSKVFVADTLTESKRKELDSYSNLLWVELRARNGYKKFGEVLKALNIPYTEPPAEITAFLDQILSQNTNLVSLDMLNPTNI